jgi:cysteine synthase
MRFISPLDALLRDIFLGITGIVQTLTVWLKAEGFNMAGSIKLRPAIQMIEDLEDRGLLRPGMRIIDSSSGNLGVALSLVCLVKGYAFTCVSDPNISQQNRRLIEACGSRVIIVTKRDKDGGFLNARIALINEMLAKDTNLFWLDQYTSPANDAAHSRWTRRKRCKPARTSTAAFIGPGTTTCKLTGCGEYIRRAMPPVKTVAVDAEASLTSQCCQAAPLHSDLTKREQEVLHWIAAGKSNWEIGKILQLSEFTVKNYVKSLLTKLAVSNRTQAASKAVSERLIINDARVPIADMERAASHRLHVREMAAAIAAWLADAADTDKDELTNAFNAVADSVRAGKLDGAEQAARDNSQAADCYRKVIAYIREHSDDYEPGFEDRFVKLVKRLAPQP